MDRRKIARIRRRKERTEQRVNRAIYARMNELAADKALTDRIDAEIEQHGPEYVQEHAHELARRDIDGFFGSCA